MVCGLLLVALKAPTKALRVAHFRKIWVRPLGSGKGGGYSDNVFVESFEQTLQQTLYANLKSLNFARPLTADGTQHFGP